MHNELKYQAKRHAISEKLSKEKKKNLCIFSPNFFFICKNNKNMLDGK